MKEFFLKKRRVFFALSMALVLVSILVLGTRGVVAGMDFVGGTKIEYRISQTGKTETIENLKASIDASTSIFYTQDSIIIKITKSTLGEDEVKEKIERTLEKSELDHELISFETISPKFGEELKNKALISILLSFGVILLYIVYRYELTFSFSAILTLIHDVLVTLLVLSIFSIEITTSTIAAILTLIGYSLNDTIILFDRIRSILVGRGGEELGGIVKLGIEKNLSRMMLTSLTTLFAITSLLLFGGEGLYSFSVVLFVGIIVGTYSSMFVSSTFLEVFKFDVVKYKIKTEEKEKRSREKERLRNQFEGTGGDSFGF